MAQRVIVETTDDVNGKPADETVVFELDGNSYEIDLTQENAKKLRKAFTPWVASARKLTKTRRTVRQVATGVDNAAVRAWAASNGIHVSPRGRIAESVVESYRAAGN